MENITENFQRLVTNLKETTAEIWELLPVITETQAQQHDEEDLQIAIIPPINMAQWIQLRRNLMGTPHINILGTNGYWRTGAVLNVALSKPTPLVSMLMQMPEVERVEVGVSEKGSGGDYYWNQDLGLTDSS